LPFLPKPPPALAGGGLGDDFLLCVENTFSSIERNPFQNSVVYKEMQLAIIRRFPCAVFYLVSGDIVSIFAVLHGHQHRQLLGKRINPL